MQKNKHGLFRVLAAAAVAASTILIAASFGAGGSPGQERASRPSGLFDGPFRRAVPAASPRHWIKSYAGFFETELVSESSGGYFNGYQTAKAVWGDGVDLNAIIPGGDGGVIVAGTASHEVGTTPLTWIQDGLIMKILPSGDVAWKVMVESDSASLERLGFAGLLPRADGGYLALGSVTSDQPNVSRFLALKLDSDRNVAWIKSYGAFDESQSFGEGAVAVAPAPDGGVVILGTTFSFGSIHQDLWAVKLNAQGNIVWQEAFGTALWDTPGDICAMPDGGFLVVGESLTYAGFSYDTSHAFVIRLSADGTPRWTRVYAEDFTDQSGYRAEARGVVSNPDGTVLVVGTSGYACHSCRTDAWMLKLNRSGSIAWQKGWRLGGNNAYPDHVGFARDGGYFVAGSGSAFSFASDGTPQWGESFGSAIYEFSGPSWPLGRPDGGLWISTKLSDYSMSDSGISYTAGTVLNLDPGGSLGGSCDVIYPGAVTTWPTHGISRPENYNFRRTNGQARDIGCRLADRLHAVKTICAGN